MGGPPRYPELKAKDDVWTQPDIRAPYDSNATQRASSKVMA